MNLLKVDHNPSKGLPLKCFLFIYLFIYIYFFLNRCSHEIISCLKLKGGREYLGFGESDLVLDNLWGDRPSSTNCCCLLLGSFPGLCLGSETQAFSLYYSFLVKIELGG